MAKPAQTAARRSQAQDEAIEGEIVEATTKALAKTPSSEDFSSVAELNESEINMQVRFAQENPRSIERAMRNIMELATLDTETAMECNYNLPRGRDDDGKAKTIEGPSIRLAELIFQQWGNNRCGSRVLKVDRKDKVIIAQGVYHDLETNAFTTAEVRRRISDKRGNLFSDDMIVVTGNAAGSIALRNAILRGIPRPIWRKVYAKVKDVIRGDAQTLGARRVELLSAFKTNLGIKPEVVYAVLGIKGEQDIGLDEIVVAAGFYSALRNNEVTVEDLLNEVKAPVGQKTLAGAFESQGAKPPTTPPHDPDTGEVKDTSRDATESEVERANLRREREAAGESRRDKAAAEAKGGEVIITGKAPAGVIHFLAGTDFLDDNGMRLTFKDGARWNTAKPTANLPVYTEVADDPAPTKEERQSAGEGSTTTQPSAPATDEKPTPTTGASTDTSSSAGGRSTETTASEDDEIDFDQGADAAEGEGEQAPAEEQVVDAESQDDDEDQVEEPQEFTDFRERVSALDSWLTVKAALKALRATDAYKTAEKADKKAIRLAARDVVEALRETGKDPIDPAADPEFYGLWLDGAAPPEVDAVWSRLIRAKAYQALPEVTRDALADATEKARAA